MHFINSAFQFALSPIDCLVLNITFIGTVIGALGVHILRS